MATTLRGWWFFLVCYNEISMAKRRSPHHIVAVFFATIGLAVLVLVIRYLPTAVLQQQEASNEEEDQRVAELQSELVATTEKIGELSEQIHELSLGYRELHERPSEIVRREVIRERSQEERLTASVAAVAPSVVSVIATKDVPQLAVEYVNPFGSDPFFRDVPIRVPRYTHQGTQEKQVGAGTGFLVTDDGLIVTNRHVVADAEARYTVLLSNGTHALAEVVHRDADLDIAILDIEGDAYSPVTLGDADALQLGSTVFAIGNALGEFSNSVSVGIISGLDRSIVASGSGGSERIDGVIQTDAAINQGNSGGPLSSLDGSVIGVNVAKVQGGENIGFAIPIHRIQTIIEEVIASLQT
jgi:S1-C subfamily serine protease